MVPEARPLTLLEREPALDALADRAECGRRQQGRTVLVSGEAGIGKTSLLKRFAASQRARPGPLGRLEIAGDAAPARAAARRRRRKPAVRCARCWARPHDRGALFGAVLDELAPTADADASRLRGRALGR